MRIFVVDGNWYLHRCWFTLKTNRPIEDVLPYNFVGLVVKDALAIKATHILVAFDGHAVFRYDVYPQYKASRSEKKSSGSSDEEGKRNVYEYLPAVRTLLERCGINWVQHKKYEADDFAVSGMAQYSKLKGVKKVVVGGQDKDVYQGLADNAVMYNSAAVPAPVYITAEKAIKSKGVPIDKMVMYQTLIGDAIDDIPTILTPAKAKKVIATYGTFKQWFAKADATEKKWLRANQVKLTINRKLVELKRDLALPEVDALKVRKVAMQDMPKAWYAYQDFLYPKAKSLFGR